MAAATMSPIARSDSSFTTPADASKQQQELPPGVWREVMLQLSTQERFVASMVCKAWRSHALSALTPDLEVSLNSGNNSVLTWASLLQAGTSEYLCDPDSSCRKHPR